MAITQTVYSPDYPSNAKTVTIDLVQRVPVGAGGDEKYVLYVYTSAYSNYTNKTSISPVYMYEMRRGWAQSWIISSPLATSGGTLEVAIDEADSGYIELTVASGTHNLSTLALNLQTQVRNTASGTGAKVDADNKLSYLNAKVVYEDGRLTFVSGSTKDSFHATEWSDTSSVQITGGTAANDLGFTTGYPNSYDIAATTSGYLMGPASAHTTMDDAITFAVETIVNQIDFSG
jgi:hypothetical protein